MNNDNVGVDLLFEASWEVCNKVGGIYTVLSTKANTLHKLYRDNVIFIGPDVWDEKNPSPFFKEDVKVLASWRKSWPLPMGVSVRTGRWNVPGKPIAVLVKFDSMYAVKDEFYGRMWNLYGVDSLHAYGDYDEACAFSHAAGIVIESLYSHLNGDSKNVVAHFDEWTTGMGLLYLKAQLPKVATVFTTHATSIGRSICGNGKPLYDYMAGYFGDQMAAELNMQSKHSLEKCAAHQADCFTTVSDITAKECEQLLERKPDVVTPNGFEVTFVPAKSRFESERKAARGLMLNTARSLTGKDLDDSTFIVATSGRCEYRNKGIDMFIDAVKRVSELNVCRKVLAYIMVPAWSREAREDLKSALKRKNKKTLSEPYITHVLNNPDSDPILNRIRQLQFNDNVTVIYVPCYLNGSDGVFNKTYYDLLIGMDATVFPSYYEPWGYTPLESVAFHVPTITTSLSGFGRWITGNFDATFQNCGVNVVERTDGNYFEATENIARAIEFLTCSDKSETTRIGNVAANIAYEASWSHFVRFYEKAYGIAMENEQRRMNAN